VSTLVQHDQIKAAPGAFRSVLTGFGAAGLLGAVAAVFGWFRDSEQLAFSYLVPFLFFLSLGLSALFFVLLQHLTRAGWSVALRRIPEVMMSVVPFFALLFIPVFLGRHELYHWTHDDAVAHDELLRHKEPYLNVTFFLIRAAAYFLVWTLLTRYFYGRSVRQDSTRDPHTTVVMQRRAAPGMILFAITLSFSSVDWIMSLDPHWYSTIFGVYIFSGTALAGFAAFLLAGMLLSRGNHVTVFRHDHFRDLGRLMFAFTVFWAYIAFSQFFLIWYGNIPEETLFYLHRLEGSWKTATLLLAVGHFAIPFVVLMARWSKKQKGVLAAMAVWVLLMHYLDMYWLVMPVLHHEGVRVHWMDVVCFLAVGGIFLALFVRKLASRSLVPVGDPRLPESLNLHNDY
jgi:hypothetical protein